MALVGLSVGAAEKILVYNVDTSYCLTCPSNAECLVTLDEAGLRAYVRRIARGGKVTHYFMCPNAQNAFFDSAVLGPEWAWEKRPGKWEVASYQRDLKKLHDAGIDPFAVWSDEARRCGISPWLSVRMNDIHNNNNTNHATHSAFWLAHPEWRRCQMKGDQYWQDLALDYAHPEVRAYMIRFLEEVFARYDVDGVELDWMRAVFHLTPGKARELSSCLDEVVAAARRFAIRAAARLGHPVRVGVRVPSRPDDSLTLGMDFLTWAKNGWVDWIVPCNYVFMVDFGLPYAEWARRVREVNPAVTVLPGMDVQVRTPKIRLVTLAEYAVFADRVYRQGAPGVYLFNPHSQYPVSGGSVWRSLVDEGLPPALVAECARGVEVSAGYDLDNLMDPEESLRLEKK